MSAFSRAQFQDAAVQHIVAKLRDKGGSRRMLLADEVGLGKTIVARGVIEALMERRQKPLTVIYLCSNTEIAEQNRTKLDPESRRPVGRVTELAIRRDDDRRLLLYSFTPGTSLKEGTGLAWERRLLMYLLHRIYGFHSWTYDWREFFRCGAGEERWHACTARAELFSEYERKTATSFQTALAAAWRNTMFDDGRAVSQLRDVVPNFDPKDQEKRSRRNRLIAALRGVMQRVVLQHLEPDLVVLDEVQRFREVLGQAGNSEHIAAELFSRRVPVLILSATPYRALTLGHEVAEGEASHHEDFFKTLDFLFDRDVATPARIRGTLTEFGQRLQRPDLADQLDSELISLKRALEEDLTKVICRTERNWYVLDRRKGVDDDTSSIDALPCKEELQEFFRLHRALAANAAMGQVTEFWKSAPSLLTFLDGKYALLKKLNEEKVRVPRSLLTSADHVSTLVERNHRIARVVDVTLGPAGASPNLWTAPTYTYYQDELFGTSKPRKLLVFSGWRFVPKAIAIITSRAASDRIGGEENSTQPLRFSEKRSFHVFDVCFPSPELAGIGQAAYVDRRRDSLPTAQEIVEAATSELKTRLGEIGVEVVPTGGHPTWQVLMRLENKGNRTSMVKSALDEWVSDDGGEGSSDTAVQHKDWAREWLADQRSQLKLSEARLQHLALVAAFSPANCVLRAFQSVYGADATDQSFGAVMALCLGPMRRYFNRPLVQQIIRAHRFRMTWRETIGDAERGYAERTLVYAADAHLQAVLDEFAYLQRHAAQGDTVAKAVAQLRDIWTLSKGSPRTNGPRGTGSSVRIELEANVHQTHFALAFGEDVSRDAGPDAEEEKLRKSVVREAFNSPFWPFVLATTSVGQEGLDFHLYCRDVLHWNLPSNPVDLEQREGRVNRRDCLAVRESIARDWPLTHPIMWTGAHQQNRNPWPVVFERIQDQDDVQKYKHGLFPHWVYECRNPGDTVRIQRHVPFFATSRDAAKYERLKTGLALYRLVFGQMNQEDLLENLQRQIQDLTPAEQAAAFRRLASYMLNLSPIGHEQVLRHAQEEADGLLDPRAPGDGLSKLLQSADQMLADRASELSEAGEDIRSLIRYIKRHMERGGKPSKAVRTAVAALAYLRNPYDRIFDLHVEGGFSDDVAVIKDAWGSINAELSPGRTRESRTPALTSV